MVSKKTIKGLDFNTIEEYFDYILDSIINGNGQAPDLFKALSPNQKLDFYKHLENQESFTLSEVLDVVNK
jgi:hypothetical protein